MSEQPVESGQFGDFEESTVWIVKTVWRSLNNLKSFKAVDFLDFLENLIRQARTFGGG